MKKINRKKQAKLLRVFRAIHRKMGALLFVFFFGISVSGFLLGLKKNSFGVLQSKTQKGIAASFKTWLPMDVLKKKAVLYVNSMVKTEEGLQIKRIDVREAKGVVKFIFSDYYAVQIDGATGEVLLLERRYSDFIEELHDGSVLDTYFKTTGNPIKLIYTTIMSGALLLFTITGFWLWLGPKRMRRRA